MSRSGRFAPGWLPALAGALLLALGAAAVLGARLGLDAYAAWWLAAAVALGVSAGSLGLGAGTILRALRLAPAALLRAGG